MVMVTAWWSAAGLVNHSFLNPGETIRPEKNAQQINVVHRKVLCMQPALINENMSGNNMYDF